MDIWRFYDITHRDHVILNPIGSEKLDEMISLLDLGPDSVVLDYGCGKGEFLLRLAARYGCQGIGVDLSPQFLAAAVAQAAARAPQANLEFVGQDGAQYDAPVAHFDLASCLGASWIWKGYRGTLVALSRVVRPGGLILVGEPFWRTVPDPEYLAAEEETADSFGTHAENAVAGAELELSLLYAMPGRRDEFDRYESLQWRAAELWAAANPDDPDRQELLDRIHKSRDTYLRWGRETLGWSLYLYRKPDEPVE